MKLNFLGIGSAFNPSLKNTSAYLEYDDCLILLDCGETVFDELYKKNLLNKKEINVIITHTHCDHVGSLGSLISYCYYILNKKKVNVIHPNERVQKYLEIVGISKDIYNYYHSFSNVNVKVQEVEVPHAKDMNSYGYILNFNDTKIFYSGDCAYVPKLILEKYFNHELDELYLDITSKKTSHTAHGNIIDLEEMIPLEYRKNVYCMHLDTDYRNIIAEKGFGVIKMVGEF